MKTINTFPITSIQGSFKGKEQPSFMVNRGIQCMRRKGGNAELMSTDIRDFRNLMKSSCQEWASIGGAANATWMEYAQYINKRYPEYKGFATGFSCFLNTNWIKAHCIDSDYQENAPTTIQLVKIVTCSGDAKAVGEGTIKLTFETSDPETAQWIYCKTTNPNPVYLKSFRSSELSHVGLTILDPIVEVVEGAAEGHDTFISCNKTFAAGDYVYVVAYVCDQYGNISKPQRFGIKLGTLA